MPAVKIIIQCRTNSTRLPGKAFFTLKSIPSIILCVKRAMQSGFPTLVATSSEKSDDALVKLLTANNIEVSRGSLTNVLDRYVLASNDMAPDDFIVRLTADNVFPDGKFIRALVDYAVTYHLPYVTTDYQQNGFPYGLGAEIFQVEMLRKAHQHANDAIEKEHVTPWIRQNCQVATFIYPEKFNLSDRRCTLDNLADYLSLQELFEQVADPFTVSWDKLCALLTTLPKPQINNLVQKQSISISPLTLGTAQLGMQYGITNQNSLLTQTQACDLLEDAYSTGITTIDCARGYGEAEKRVGLIWKHRKDLTVITKLDPFLEERTNSSDYKNFVKASVFRSCYELQTDYLPILLLHRFSHYQNSLIFNELQALQSEGFIKLLGVSVNTPTEAEIAANDPKINILQLPYNLLDRRWHTSNLQNLFKQRSDLIIFARSIFLQGLLISPLSLWPAKFQIIGQKVLPQLSELAISLARENIHDLCIAYVKAQSWINSIVIGCATLPQLQENVTLFNKPALTLEEHQLVVNSLTDLPENFLNPSLW